MQAGGLSGRQPASPPSPCASPAGLESTPTPAAAGGAGGSASPPFTSPSATELYSKLMEAQDQLRSERLKARRQVRGQHAGEGMLGLVAGLHGAAA